MSPEEGKEQEGRDPPFLSHGPVHPPHQSGVLRLRHQYHWEQRTWSTAAGNSQQSSFRMMTLQTALTIGMTLGSMSRRERIDEMLWDKLCARIHSAVMQRSESTA